MNQLVKYGKVALKYALWFELSQIALGALLAAPVVYHYAQTGKVVLPWT